MERKVSGYHIVTVDTSNIDDFGFFCVKNKKHPGYRTKHSWLKKRFAEGMRIKLILTPEGDQAGFLEYIPGEFTWRVVNAPGYLVIHCIWVNSWKHGYTGMASTLIDHCIQDAESNKKSGVAVVSSDGSWMARKDIFLNNGFTQADEAAPHFQLLIKKIRSGQIPSFPQNWEERLKKLSGLQLLYTNQCPYIGKAILELPPVAEKFGIGLKLIELTDAQEAREQMVSPYGIFNLVYNDRLLADHPISATRFENILNKQF